MNIQKTLDLHFFNNIKNCEIKKQYYEINSTYVDDISSCFTYKSITHLHTITAIFILTIDYKRPKLEIEFTYSHLNEKYFINSNEYLNAIRKNNFDCKFTISKFTIKRIEPIFLQKFAYILSDMIKDADDYFISIYTDFNKRLNKEQK